MNDMKYQPPGLRIKLKVAILESGYSQVSLAKKIGVDQGVISRIVHGWLNPTKDQLTKIARALGVKNPDDLLK